MSSDTVKLHLKQLEDPNCDPDILSGIWKQSKSFKVRRAVAQHPNASPMQLRIAARLYLEDVLQNPAWDVFALFDDDKWIEQINKIYLEPWNLTTAGWRVYRTDSAMTAALLSPSLDYTVLARVLEMMPTTKLNRLQKMVPSLKPKIREIVLNQHHNMTPSAVLTIAQMNVLSASELLNVIRNVRSSGSRFKSGQLKTIIKTAFSKWTGPDRDAYVQILAGILVRNPGRSRALSNALTTLSAWYVTDGTFLEFMASLLRFLQATSHDLNVLPDATFMAVNQVGQNFFYAIHRQVAGTEENYFDAFSDKAVSLGFSAGEIRKLSIFLRTRMEAVKFGISAIPVLAKATLKGRELYFNSCYCELEIIAHEKRLELLEQTNNDIYARDGIGPSLLFNSVGLENEIPIKMRAS